MHNPVSRFLWLWIPLFWMAFQIGLEITVDPDILAHLHAEGGIQENAQFAILLGCVFLALRIITLPGLKSDPLVFGWCLIALLACIFVAGEEESWGQHILNWRTPEYWAAINDQDETNLHNTSSWFDQKPRLALMTGVLVGGLVVPALRRWKPGLLPARLTMLYPPSTLFFVALMVAMVKLADLFSDMSGIHTFARASEVIELYMYYFVLLYLMDFYDRAQPVYGKK